MNILEIDKEIKACENKLTSLKEQRQRYFETADFYPPDTATLKFDPNKILRILCGSLVVQNLESCFSWTVTPQGSNYWAVVSIGETLSNDNRLILLNWVTNYYRKNPAHQNRMV
jgi:hypothetical protein